MTRLILLRCALAPSFAQSNHEAALKGLKFREIGPAIMGGRIDDFAVVESDPRTIYVGTASAGVFKTVNGGITWEPVFRSRVSSSSMPETLTLGLAPTIRIATVAEVSLSTLRLPA
jgi:hypothetical protein